jgi:heme exporter protein C
VKKRILLGLGFLLILLSLYLVFVFVPTEKEMGIVQRIFYLMVPSAWTALLSFLFVFAASILYLASRKSKWDILAHSAAEIGLTFTGLTLIVGSIWARPIWGVWWTWEARLTATLVLWFIYLTYFIVPSMVTDESRAARFAAVVGIVGFLDVPIVILATTLWRGLHPAPIIFQGGIAPPMLLTILASVAAFTVLYFILLMLRVSIKTDEVELKKLRELPD